MRSRCPAISLVEAFSRRGLLGLLVNSKNIDERLSDVKIYFTNPITGKKELSLFSNVENVYNTLSKTNDKNNFILIA